jgi:prefoldin beta subunit
MNKDSLQEIQILEQNLQNILLQKQMFQLELAEIEAAVKEVENSKDEVFKIVGQIMVKTDKEKITEELSNKQKLLDLRLKALQKQESSLEKRLETLKEKIMNPEKK